MQFPGLDWLNNFTAACKNCTFDFIPLHYYGDNSTGASDGFEWHVKEIHTVCPNTKLWITEFADVGTLEQTQTFFNTTIQFLDSNDYIERYSYFGAFRSTKSNVGPNATFLNANGKLTDVGSWYLGGAATNDTPTASTATSSSPASTQTHTSSSASSTSTHAPHASSIYNKSKEELAVMSLVSMAVWWVSIAK